MANHSFRTFLHSYLEIWRNSSITDLKNIISKDYQAREISGGDVMDFGYDESIAGWEQGFTFAKEGEDKWDLNEVSTIPLREDEVMVILSATLVIDGKKLEDVSLFFQTFKRQENDGWKLLRSYIETGVPDRNIDKIQFN